MKTARTFTAIVTGHGDSLRHVHKIELTNSPLCRHEKTVTHMLCHRPLSKQKVTGKNTGHSLSEVYYNSYPKGRTTEGPLQSGRGSQREYTGAHGLNKPTHRQKKSKFCFRKYFIIKNIASCNSFVMRGSFSFKFFEILQYSINLKQLIIPF